MIDFKSSMINFKDCEGRNIKLNKHALINRHDHVNADVLLFSVIDNTLLYVTSQNESNVCLLII
jgi:hypothetical protein